MHSLHLSLSLPVANISTQTARQSPAYCREHDGWRFKTKATAGDIFEAVGPATVYATVIEISSPCETSKK